MTERTTLQVPRNELNHLLQNRRGRFRMLVGILVSLVLIILLAASYVIGSTTLGLWAVAGILGVIVATLILLQPELGAYILVAMVYLNLSSIIELSIGIPSLNKYIVALIFIGTIANRIFLQRKTLRIDRTQRLILMYGLILLIASLRADNAEVSWEGLIDWVKDYAILFILVQLSDKERVWKRMQWVLILAALFLTSMTVYQTLTDNYGNNFMGLANAPVHEITTGNDRVRPTGPLDDPNFYAQILLMVMPMALYRFFAERSPLLKYIAFMATIFIVAGAIFTYSRGALLALVVVGVLVIWERGWNPYKTGFILLLIMLVALPLLPQGYVDRVGKVFDVFSQDIAIQDERSLTGRTSEMIIAVQIFLDNPVFGVGPDNYEKNYLDYSVRLGLDSRLQERNAHSLFLETAAELGLIGLIVFTAMLVSALAMMHSAKQQLAKIERKDLLPWITGVQFALVSYMATSLVLHGDYIRYFWLLMGLAVSVGYVADRATEQYAEAQKALRKTRSRILPVIQNGVGGKSVS